MNRMSLIIAASLSLAASSSFGGPGGVGSNSTSLTRGLLTQMPALAEQVDRMDKPLALEIAELEQLLIQGQKRLTDEQTGRLVKNMSKLEKSLTPADSVLRNMSDALRGAGYLHSPISDKFQSLVAVAGFDGRDASNVSRHASEGKSINDILGELRGINFALNQATGHLVVLFAAAFDIEASATDRSTDEAAAYLNRLMDETPGSREALSTIGNVFNRSQDRIVNAQRPGGYRTISAMSGSSFGVYTDLETGSQVQKIEVELVRELAPKVKTTLSSMKVPVKAVAARGCSAVFASL